MRGPRIVAAILAGFVWATVAAALGLGFGSVLLTSVAIGVIVWVVLRQMAGRRE